MPPLKIWMRILPDKKQASMKKKFEQIGKRTVGMRGIWFNTYSYVRDIKVYSDEIWKQSNSQARDALWLAGAERQNVASIDFLDQEKAQYVVRMNPHPGFAGQAWTGPGEDD